MTKADWTCFGLCAIWLGWMIAAPMNTGLTITVDGDVLNAVVTGVAILFSTVAAIGVPLLLRRIEAADAKQDALDAAMDLGRWTFAAVVGFERFGIMEPKLEAAVRLHILVAEERVRAVPLLPLRSVAASRRYRHIQRLGRTLADEIRKDGAADADLVGLVSRTADELVTGVRSLAQLVEGRVDITADEIRARLNLL